MHLVVVRHGETDWNVDKKLQGTQDIPLNRNGVRQMEKVGASFDERKLQFSVIATSPLVRAVQSAEICARHVEAPLRMYSQFQERSFGNLEGLLKSDLLIKYNIQDVEKLDGSEFGMELISSLRERIAHGLHILQQQYAREHVLLVTHGSVLKQMVDMYGAYVMESCIQEIEPHNLGNEAIVPNGTYVEFQW